MIVAGNCLLRGAKAPICYSDVWEVCCLPGECFRDLIERIPSLIQSSDYYSLLRFCVGRKDTASSSMSLIKKDYRVRGVAVKDYGAQVVFAFYENHSMTIAFDYSFTIILLFFFPQVKGVPDPCEQVLLHLCNVPTELRVLHENLDVSLYIYPCETRVCAAFYL